MARVIGQSGALKHLFSELRKENITPFQSLDSIQNFRRNWKEEIKSYRDEMKLKLNEEIKSLEEKHLNLTQQSNRKREIRTKVLIEEKEDIKPELRYYSSKQDNLMKRITFFLKRKRLMRRLRILEDHFEKELNKPFRKLIRDIQKIRSHLDYRKKNYEAIIDQRSKKHNQEIIRIKSVIHNLEPLIAGAVGEEKAIEELAKLPDDYIVINDYYHKFQQPIYNRKTKDRILSIQVDHIIIGSSGIFLVETKFWSKASIENLDLFSPVRQIKRANYAVFLLLNKAVEYGKIRLSSHHWGDKKISVRNILLMVGEKPNQEFQYVKVLSLNEVRGYLTYFEPVFSKRETEKIVEFIHHD